jgi:hypothetical protein
MAELDVLKEEIKSLPEISEDTGWKGKFWGAGITDYSRRVFFARPLTEDELKLWVSFLQKDNCPGWTQILVRLDTDGYVFQTTMDSSG